MAVMYFLSWQVYCGGETGQNEILTLKLDLTLKVKVTPKTIRILTKGFCNSSPNLVILAWMSHKLLRRQAQGWHMDTLTDR